MKKEIEIDYTEGEGKDKIDMRGKVTLKRLSFSEKNSLEEESTEVKMLGRQPTVKISTAKLKELAILKSVVASELFITTYTEGKEKDQWLPITAPYALNITGIKELPMDVGEFIFEEYSSINELGEKKKES